MKITNAWDFLILPPTHPNPPSLLHSLLLPNPRLLSARFPVSLVFSFCVSLTHFVNPPPHPSSLARSNCPSHSAMQPVLWLTLTLVVTATCAQKHPSRPKTWFYSVRARLTLNSRRYSLSLCVVCVSWSTLWTLAKLYGVLGIVPCRECRVPTRKQTSHRKGLGASEAFNSICRIIGYSYWFSFHDMEIHSHRRGHLILW